MPRVDISDYLIHFTHGDSDESAFLRLGKILRDGALLGTGRKIRGSYPCICFSEAPLPALRDGLVNPEFYSRYSPFGLMFTKTWIFNQGGRPAIYQPDEEFELLVESMRWRHVRYEPNRFPPIDFTWEREWRVPGPELRFDLYSAAIVLPDQSWAERMFSEHEHDMHYLVQAYRQVLGEIAEAYWEPFQWRIATLR